MSTSGDWLPRSRAARLEMANMWYDVMTRKIAQWDWASVELTAMSYQINKVKTATTQFASAPTPGNRTRLREAYDGLVSYMRQLRRQRFTSPPFIDSDYADLGLRPPDTIRTTHFEVTEKVAYTLEPGKIREVVIHFQIEGADHRAKPAGYDGAVVIYAVGEFPFVRVEDLKDGHEMASRTPAQKHFVLLSLEFCEAKLLSYPA